mgnify:CR=1|jgi:hypothetical protein
MKFWKNKYKWYYELFVYLNNSKKIYKYYKYIIISSKLKHYSSKSWKILCQYNFNKKINWNIVNNCT